MDSVITGSRQLPAESVATSADTTQDERSHRASIDSRPSTAASTLPSSVPASHFRPSEHQSDNHASQAHSLTGLPTQAAEHPARSTPTSSTSTHQISYRTARNRPAPASKSPFKKALAALGLSERDKAKREERIEQGGRPENSKLGPVDAAREQGRRALRYVKRKLNSKTPKEELPKTWEEYGKAYAARYIDVDDPPLPPSQADSDINEPTPFEQRVYMAPRPHNEAVRQNVVNRLDLFGTRAKADLANAQSPTFNESSHVVSTAPSLSNASTASLQTQAVVPAARRRGSTTASVNSTVPSVVDDGIEAPVSESLENHPIFRSIVSRCREVFNTKVGLITILDEDQQLFLAAGGMPDGVDKLPRDVTFCSHAILGEEKGMVVLDTQKDWRFANNLPSTALGARFYAGVPLFARTSGQESAPSVPIGTICVADVVPREEFTEAHRRVLRDFATQASNAIEQWASQRMAIKLARLHGSLTNASLPDLPKLSSEMPLLTPPSSAGLPPASNTSTTSLPARPKTAPSAPPPGSGLTSPPASLRQFQNNNMHSRHTSVASTSSTVASSVGSFAAPSASSYAQRPSTALAFAITTDDPVSLVPREIQKMFDTAMKMLTKALSLDLVYLAALDLHVLPEPTLRILSAQGLPSPAPSFDPKLHLKALRSPEGGLVYKNPRFIPNGSGSYSSGILIPVIEVRRVGYVLCGYTTQPERQFVQRDLGYLVRFAEQLETGCVKLGRSDQVASLMQRSPSAASASSSGSFRGRYD